MRFWRSGIGQRRVAYEIKVSRADFLGELRRPKKRARAMEISHQFYFAAPQHLIKPHEIPDDCGLIEYVGKKTRIKVEAPIREPRWLNEQEVLYLLRLDLFRSKAPQLQQQLSSWRYSCEYMREQLGKERERGRERDKEIAALRAQLAEAAAEPPLPAPPAG